MQNGFMNINKISKTGIYKTSEKKIPVGNDQQCGSREASAKSFLQRGIGERIKIC